MITNDKLRIQILSDTHNTSPEKLIDLSSDLIIHAGDFGNYGPYYANEYVQYCIKNSKDLVFVLGNHDYYGTNIKGITDYFKSINANILIAGEEFKWKGYTFIGDTLFSNFRANKIEHSDPLLFDKYKNDCRALIDFTNIGNIHSTGFITPEEYVSLHNQQWNFLQKYKNKDDVIIVSHFPLSLACLDPYWSTHEKAKVFNPYFINDRDLTGFKFLISGHTHTAIDTIIDGCRVIINPYGHGNEIDNNGYKHNFYIELESKETND